MDPAIQEVGPCKVEPLEDGDALVGQLKDLCIPKEPLPLNLPCSPTETAEPVDDVASPDSPKKERPREGKGRRKPRSAPGKEKEGSTAEPLPDDQAQDETTKKPRSGNRNYRNGPYSRRGDYYYQKRRPGNRRWSDKRNKSQTDGENEEKSQEEGGKEAKKNTKEMNGTEEEPKKDAQPFRITCVFCRVTLKSPGPWKSHLCSDKHQGRLYRQANFDLTKEIKASIEKSIRVSGYPTEASQKSLYDYFSSYGLVQNFFCSRDKNYRRRHCVIEYKDENVMEEVLKMQHFWNERRIEVIKHKKLENGDQGGFSTDLEDISKKLEGLDTFTEQVTTLTGELELSEKETKQRLDLTAMVQEKFRSLFPGCTAEPFGSSVNSLGVHECDLDVFVDLGIDDWNEERKIEKDETPTAHLPSQRDRVRMGVKLLRNMRNVSMVIPIPNARVPILKFRYTPSSLYCDVSFRNPMSVCNTKLLFEFAAVDTRVRDVMMLVRYWDAQYGISGKGRYLEMTKYALTMLVVFVMQNFSPPLLPSVKEIQTCNEDPKLIDGWNFSFSMESFKSSPNDMSIKDIAIAFFKYYADFDFKNNVICPYVGKIFPRTDFAYPERLSQEFGVYKQKIESGNTRKLELETAMCVQDPFELALNITRQMSDKAVELFQKSCTEALKLCTTEEEPGLLVKLLTPSPESIKEREKQKKRGKGDAPMSMAIPLPKKMEEETIVEYVKDVLKQAFLIEFSEVDNQTASPESSEAKTTPESSSENGEAKPPPEAAAEEKKPEEESNEANAEKEPKTKDGKKAENEVKKGTSFKCSSSHATWEGRFIALRKIGIPLDQINMANERQITDYVIENFKAAHLKTAVSFVCNVANEEEPPRSVISFKNVSVRNLSFHRLRATLKKLLPSLVEAYIKEKQS